MDYQKHIESKGWEETRAEIMAERGFACQKCSGKSNLVVHHKSYANLGHEKGSELVLLCRDCHDSFHSQFGVGEDQELTRNTELWLLTGKFKKKKSSWAKDIKRKFKKDNLTLLERAAYLKQTQSKKA